MLKTSEFQEQCFLFKWALSATKTYPQLKYLHSSQNGMTTSVVHAVNAKRAGMKRGVPDISLPYNNGKFSSLFIEMKNGKNKLTKEQEDFFEFLGKQGFKCVVCYSAKDAIKEIIDYVS